MKKHTFRALSLMLAVLILTAAVPYTAVAAEGIEMPSLYKIYQDSFMLGSIFMSRDLTGDRFELTKHHFNALTAENDMKPSYLSKSKGNYSFSGVDSMLSTIEKAGGIAVHGHTLAWHSQSAAWLNVGLTRKDAKANLEAYIKAVAEHYAGQLISWDVVNEAFQNSVGSVQNHWTDALRKDGWDGSAWYQAYANGADAGKGESGADYIYDAFVFARIADPDAILYYNDYNETETGKREAIAQMTEELNKKWETDSRNTEPGRLLIEGIGMQSHYWVDYFSLKAVEDSIKRFAQTGAIISISELDIPAGRWDSYTNYKTTTPSDDVLKKQATYYAQLFQLYKKYADDIERVSIWGLTDNYSWRYSGVLFDSNLNAKPAFYAVADPDGYLAGKYDDPKTRAAVLIAAKLDEAAPMEQEDPAGPDLSTATEWAKVHLTRALELDLIPESLQANYQKPATRADFCALAVKLIEEINGKEITERKEFTDTTDINVQKIGGMSIVTGVGGGAFNPNGVLTRQDAAVILAKMMNKLGKPLPEKASTFSDIETAAEYAVTAIGQMELSRIMTGTGGGFSPQNDYSIEMCVTTLLKALDYK